MGALGDNNRSRSERAACTAGRVRGARADGGRFPSSTLTDVVCDRRGSRTGSVISENGNGRPVRQEGDSRRRGGRCQPAGVALEFGDADDVGATARRAASSTGWADPGSVNRAEDAVIQYGSGKASARPTPSRSAKYPSTV